MKCSSPNFIKKTFNFNSNKYDIQFINMQDKVHQLDGVYEGYIEKGYIPIPCGKCLSCRLNYSRDWANRCWMESQLHQFTWFVTLTYDDQHLVYGNKGFPTLEKDGISKFIKNLRNKFRDVQFRYFGCGEYGEGQGERCGFNPHHHIIIFGLPLSDLTEKMPDMSKPLNNGKYPYFTRKNNNGDFVYWSQSIFDCWQKGKIEVEEASWNCAAYVSRYVVKKAYGQDKKLYNDLGIIPEYIRMSNRPGIGSDYLKMRKEAIFRYDKVYLTKNGKGISSLPPRYFTKLMQKDETSDDFVRMQEVLQHRKDVLKKLIPDSSHLISEIQKRRDDNDRLLKRNKAFTRNLT